MVFWILDLLQSLPPMSTGFSLKKKKNWLLVPSNTTLLSFHWTPVFVSVNMSTRDTLKEPTSTRPPTSEITKSNTRIFFLFSPLFLTPQWSTCHSRHWTVLNRIGGSLHFIVQTISWCDLIHNSIEWYSWMARSCFDVYIYFCASAAIKRILQPGLGRVRQNSSHNAKTRTFSHILSRFAKTLIQSTHRSFFSPINKIQLSLTPFFMIWLSFYLSQSSVTCF